MSHSGGSVVLYELIKESCSPEARACMHARGGNWLSFFPWPKYERGKERGGDKNASCESRKRDRDRDRPRMHHLTLVGRSTNSFNLALSVWCPHAANGWERGRSPG